MSKEIQTIRADHIDVLDSTHRSVRLQKIGDDTLFEFITTDGLTGEVHRTSFGLSRNAMALLLQVLEVARYIDSSLDEE